MPQLSNHNSIIEQSMENTLILTPSVLRAAWHASSNPCSTYLVSSATVCLSTGINKGFGRSVPFPPNEMDGKILVSVGWQFIRLFCVGLCQCAGGT